MKKIALSNGGYALVSDKDHPYLRHSKWSRRRKRSTSDVWYAMRWNPETRINIPMQRDILGSREGYLIDHRDGNGLNNMRSNLRFSTPLQNNRNRKIPSHNTTGYKGLRYYPFGKGGCWMARIKIFGRYIQLGYYKTKEEAAIAYNIAAKKHFGAFARLNQLPPEFANVIPQSIKPGTRPRINNTSGYEGVGYFKQSKSWYSRLRYESQVIYFGYFDSKEEAAYIRDQFALQLFGDSAKLNILNKEYDPANNL